MRKLLTIITLFLFAIPVFASTTPYRTYYPKTKKYYPCDEIKWTSKGTYCYELKGTTYYSHGLGTLQRWTGLYDSTGKKIFEGDVLTTPGIPVNTLVMYGTTSTYIGFYLLGTDGKAYSLKDFSGLSKNKWSTVI